MAIMPFAQRAITTEQAHLLVQASDGVFEPLIEHYGLLPYRYFDSVYKGLITTVLSQQLSDRALKAIVSNLPDEYFTSPSWLLSHIEQHDRSMAVSGTRLIPFSQAKITALKSLLVLFDRGVITEQSLMAMTREQRAHILGSCKGIGPWSLDMAEMFIFAAPDIFPLGDQGVQNAVMLLLDINATGLTRHDRLDIIAAFRDRIRSPQVLTLATFYLWALNADTDQRESFRALAESWRPDCQSQELNSDAQKLSGAQDSSSDRSPSPSKAVHTKAVSASAVGAAAVYGGHDGAHGAQAAHGDLPDPHKEPDPASCLGVTEEQPEKPKVRRKSCGRPRKGVCSSLNILTDSRQNGKLSLRADWQTLIEPGE